MELCHEAYQSKIIEKLLLHIPLSAKKSAQELNENVLHPWQVENKLHGSFDVKMAIQSGLKNPPKKASEESKRWP
jgi:predicted transposase YbfD/YdcC